MGGATIRDVARLAGVSTATVDRALNGRAGVRPANRQRVLMAARALGYLPVQGLVALPAQPAHLSFLIPFGGDGFMHVLGRSIAEAAAASPLVASCRVVALDGIGPDALERAVAGLDGPVDGVGLIATDHPRANALIRDLSEAGVRVATLVTDVPGAPRAAYVGVDNHAAGRTAGQVTGLAAGRAGGPVAVLTGSHAYSGHREREAGFRAVLAEGFAALAALPAAETAEQGGRSFTAVRRLLAATPDLAAIYCLGAGQGGVVEALGGARAGERPFVVLHELSEASRGWLAEGLIDVVIDQNARLVGEEAVVHLLGAVAAGGARLPVRFIEPRIILRENLPP